MAVEIERTAVERAYDRWAPIYDLVFGPVFERGRWASIEAAERIGGRILEIGVGTGISLPHYARRNRIVGVDISEAMLKKARNRVAELDLTHVEALEVMDAERLNFADDSFDVVVAQYVVTAVPNPEAALDQFARVVKPGGRDHPVEPHRCRSRPAPYGRTLDCTGRPKARMAHRVSVAAIHELGCALGAYPLDRTAPDAASRPFFANPLWQTFARLSKHGHVSRPRSDQLTLIG